MRQVWLLGLIPALGCMETKARAGSAPASRELIPAEWTVSEDTSESGEITTASLQLPAAKEIEGLVKQGEPPRLILRCVDGKVAASIDTALPDSVADQMVAIQLDSAPACE